MTPDDAVLIDACLEAGATMAEHGPGIVARQRGVLQENAYDYCDGFLTLRMFKSDLGYYQIQVRGSDERDFGCALIPFRRLLVQVPDPYAYEELTEI